MGDVQPGSDKEASDRPIRLGLVGVGTIARSQHLPAIAASSHFTLVATADPSNTIDGVRGFGSLEEMLSDGPDLDAVSICTPPRGRDAIAAKAIAARKHVMLEKPPGATVAEVEALRRRARAAGVTLFAAWHSREAAAVVPAREWLRSREVCAARITWRENIRRWHPGQDWILEAGGFGVFDPAINALSIATAVLPHDLVVRQARMAVPCNRQAPVSAEVALSMAGLPVTMTLDFLQRGDETWTISIDAGGETLDIIDGGAGLRIGGDRHQLAPVEIGEYGALYRNFAKLIAASAIDVDVTPLQLVADAFLVGERFEAAPFDW